VIVEALLRGKGSARSQLRHTNHNGWVDSQNLRNEGVSAAEKFYAARIGSVSSKKISRFPQERLTVLAIIVGNEGYMRRKLVVHDEIKKAVELGKLHYSDGGLIIEKKTPGKRAKSRLV